MNSSDEQSLPKALWVWDNHARLTLPRPLLAWLSLLVVTCLSSAFFLRGHNASRWVLGGFIASHVLVLGLSTLKTFTLRRGIVSLKHIICWTPGLIYAIADAEEHSNDLPYAAWRYAIIAVLSIAFLFDLRDAGTYLCYQATGRIRERVE